MYSSNEDSRSSSSSLEAEEERYQHLKRIKVMAAFAVANIVATAALIYADPFYNKIPYHTSALTGANWVLELLNGHPERIRNELGVHKHVFNGLIEELKFAGHGPSRHLYLEEQLAIFLYTCVTGLSLRHVCERFQHSCETISK